MRVYLDASVLVALLTSDPFTERARALLRSDVLTLVLSDFAAAEFASAIGRRVRMRDITVAEARLVFSALDGWGARAAELVETTWIDVRVAQTALRRLDLTLRTADAVNIAIAQRVDAALATFDRKMADCARHLGGAVAFT